MLLIELASVATESGSAPGQLPVVVNEAPAVKPAEGSADRALPGDIAHKHTGRGGAVANAGDFGRGTPKIPAMAKHAVGADTANPQESARDTAYAGAVDVSGYYRLLESHLARFHRYSEEGRQQRLSGVVRVALVVQRDGQVLDARIEKSSGESALDEAALATVQRAAPMPAIPQALPGMLNLIVPITFILLGGTPAA